MTRDQETRLEAVIADAQRARLRQLEDLKKRQQLLDDAIANAQRSANADKRQQPETLAFGQRRERTLAGRQQHMEDLRERRQRLQDRQRELEAVIATADEITEMAQAARQPPKASANLDDLIARAASAGSVGGKSHPGRKGPSTEAERLDYLIRRAAEAGSRAPWRHYLAQP